MTITRLEKIERDERGPQHAVAVVAEVWAAGVTLYFDGEDTPSEKSYIQNADLTLEPGDRVILDRVAGTWVVAYKIAGGGSL